MKSIQPSLPTLAKEPGRENERWRRGDGHWAGRDPADSKTVAIFIGHPRADRRMIFHHMPVAINYFVYFGTHVISFFIRAYEV